MKTPESGTGDSGDTGGVTGSDDDTSGDTKSDKEERSIYFYPYGADDETNKTILYSANVTLKADDDSYEETLENYTTPFDDEYLRYFYKFEDVPFGSYTYSTNINTKYRGYDNVSGTLEITEATENPWIIELPLPKV